MSCEYIEFPQDQEIEGGVSADTPFNFPPEGDYALFWFTAETFLKVLSALWNGAEITYPDTAFQVIWDFLKNVDNPVPICAKIIECIETDEDTRAAFAAFVAEHPKGIENPKDIPLPAGVTAANTLPDNPGCDPDYVWGGTLETVRTAKRAIDDFIDVWTTFTERLEVAQAIADGFPILSILADALGIDAIIEYATSLAAAIGEAFQGDYTEEYEIQLACDLFCIAKDDCTLSLDQIVEVLQSRVEGQLTAANIVELFLSLIDLDITGINVADVYLLFFFKALSLGNLYVPINYGVEFYLRVVEAMAEPDDGWIALCEDCPPPTSGPWILWTERVAQPVGILTQSSEGTSGSVSVVATIGSDDLYRVAVFSPGTGISGCKTITSASGYSPQTYSEQGCTGIAGSFTGTGFMDRIYIVNDAPFTFAFTWTD